MTNVVKADGTVSSEITSCGEKHDILSVSFNSSVWFDGAVMTGRDSLVSHHSGSKPWELVSVTASCCQIGYANTYQGQSDESPCVY
jgi:hypothetical protein